MELEKSEGVKTFYSLLSTLMCSSLANIKMLTILAENYIEHAPEIVEAVERHIQQVRQFFKYQNIMPFHLSIRKFIL